MAESPLQLEASPPEALVNVLDRLLDTGIVVDGQIVLSVAGIDLIFVGLRAMLASMDTAMRMTLASPLTLASPATAQGAP